MSIKPSTARHRTDASSAPLITLLVSSGVGYEAIGAAVDGFAYLGNAVALIDFKSAAKSKRTKRQIAMVARGVPLWFVVTDDDALNVVRWLRAQRNMA